MYDYYCKNCNNIIVEWHNECKYYDISNNCNYIRSKNIKSIYFLDCLYCNKFVGIKCYDVCKNCFGEDEIVNEKVLYNWIQNYKKLISYNNTCKICNNRKFRHQCWFFKELTYYK